MCFIFSEVVLMNHTSRGAPYMTQRCIDYVWYLSARGMLGVTRVGLFGDRARDGIHLSDHFGHYAEFTLNK